MIEVLLNDCSVEQLKKLAKVLYEELREIAKDVLDDKNSIVKKQQQFAQDLARCVPFLGQELRTQLAHDISEQHSLFSFLYAESSHQPWSLRFFHQESPPAGVDVNQILGCLQIYNNPKL